MSLKTFLFFPLLFVSFLVRAQNLSSIKIIVTEGSTVSEKDALLYLPASYSSTKKYPLVVYTHGLGEAGTDVTKLYATGLPKVLKDGYQPAFDFIMIAVQSASYSVAPQWLSSILDQSISRWNIDTGRIYLTGISAGGWGAFGSQLNISSQFGSRFAAIVVNSGATQNVLKTNLDWWKTTKTPLWATVGGADESYLLQSTFMVDEVNKRVAGLATLTVRPGVAHGGWDDVYKGAVTNDGKNMWQWLYQFNRAASDFPKPSSTLLGTEPVLFGSATTSTASSEAKVISVNIYGGSNAYTSSGWNNWNVTTSLSSGTLKYTDASSSAVSAVLSKSSGVNDNGSTYGSGMAPAGVLRYTSNATAARTLTFSGLSSSKKYSLELYASRNNYNGNYTVFTINGIAQKLSTYKNLTSKASFSGISPNASGQIVVSISNDQTYNYLNGFTLTEEGSTTSAVAQTEVITTTAASSSLEGKEVNVNIYGGTNAYTATGWNNWNTTSTLSAGALKYSDATTSAVSATLSKSSGINDNGSTYGSGMAPAGVLRYTSNATVARTLTLGGLSTSKTYNLELYSSRNNYSGNYTVFSINGATQKISTYKNLTLKASFTSLVPNSSGQIVVSISNAQTYNYLNGFTLTENGGTTTAVTEPIVTTVTTTTGTFANHTLPATSGYVNYATGIPISNLKPGDTINVLAGTYTALIFGNFKGDASRPIVIRNKGGQVKTGEIRLTNDAQYFKILGNGHSATKYGFKVYRTDYSGINVPKARDFEIAYCEVYGMNVGIFIKNNPVSTDASTIYPNYVFKNIYLHHNYVHNIAKEGMYIGHSDPDGGQAGNPLVPVRHENIEIAYNIVDQTGWDGIQLGNARTGNKVHHNTVTNYGTLNASGQRSGIELGSNTSADVYENTVKNGTGTGIMVFGYGAMKVYNNLLEKCGSSYAIYANPYISGPETNPKQQMTITNNTVNYPPSGGAIKVGGLAENSLPSIIQNNKILLPNPPSNWAKLHFYSVVPGSTITGNTLISL